MGIYEALERITVKGAVEELRSQKGKAPWRKSISFQKTKRNWFYAIGFMLKLVPFIIFIFGPAVGYVMKAWLTAYIILFLFWVVIFVAILMLYLPLAYLSFRLAIRRHGSEEDGIRLGMSYAHYIQLRHEVEESEPVLRGAGSEALLVGENKDYMVNYADEPNPHTIIVGGSGSGKTVTTKAFATRSALKYGLKLLVIDWNGEYESYADSIGATTWHVPKELKINPFALRGADIADRASSIIDLLVFGARLTPLQANTVRSAVLGFYAKDKEPTLIEIDRAILAMRSDRKQSDLTRQQADLIDQRFRSVQRVVGYEPDDFYKRMLSSNNVINLVGLNDYEKGLVSYAIMQRIYEEFNRQPQLNTQVRLIIVLDEAWQILQTRMGDEALESLPSRIVRLGRKYGFGILVSTQQIEDVPNTFINSSAVKVVHSYHGASVFGSTRDVFGFGDFENAYIKTAERGEALVLDKGRAMQGQLWPDYVKVDKLTDKEMEVLRKKAEAYKPEPINEPELPLDIGTKTKAPQKSNVESFKPPEDRPTPSSHAALLAIYDNKDAKLADLAKYVKAKGWISGDPTIYGSKGRKGIFENLINLGLAKKEGDKYALTDKGSKWVNPESILETESEIGSDLHKQLLIKTIKYLHEKNMFVMATPQPESFDLIAYPIDAKKKFMWDDKNRKAYEIQTTARKDSVLANADKKDKYKIPITWVAYEEGMLDEIKRLTENKDEYLLLKI
jgi:hypothetical protein